MRRLGSKVTIYANQKIDGRYNTGKIIGIELTPDAYYLGHRGEKSYLSQFTVPKYKIAYVDCFTNRGCTEWHSEDDLIPKDS